VLRIGGLVLLDGAGGAALQIRRDTRSG
jgi:hypothetical protein